MPSNRGDTPTRCRRPADGGLPAAGVACLLALLGCYRTARAPADCSVDAGRCSPSARCVETGDAWLCICKAGYEGNGLHCYDIDECGEGSHDCANLATCTNDAGGYTCTCPPGTSGDGTVCHARSCAEIRRLSPEATDGSYVVNTGFGGPLAVYCDMTSDGGVGHTMVRFDDPSLGGNQNDYKTLCEAHGMEVIVPRSRAHARAIVAFNNGELPNLVGVHPKYRGAVGLANWQGRCQGRPCGFWLSDSDNADCHGFEPNGNNSVSYMIMRTDVGCDYGAWNDQGNSVIYQGTVICSTNDVPVEPRESCWSYLETDSLQNRGAAGISGVYDLEVAGRRFAAHCDMINDGGGWTLALKMDGTRVTFRYDSPLWTTDSTHNPDAPGLDTAEAKLEAFNVMPFARIRLGMRPLAAGEPSGPYRYLHFRRPQASAGCAASEPCTLLDLFSAGQAVTTRRGGDAWRELLPGGPALPHAQEGFNVECGGAAGARVRVGMVGDEAADCSTPDSRLGLGADGASCGMEPLNAAGSAAGADCAGSGLTEALDERVLGVIFVR